MAKENAQTNTHATQWLPIGLSILSLVISIAAWNKTGDTSIADQLKELQVNQQTFNQKSAFSNASQRLDLVRRDFAQNRNYENAQKSIDEIRRDLRVSFQNADKNAQKTWQNINNDLAKIDLQLSEKAVDVLDTIDALIIKLKSAIQPQ